MSEREAIILGALLHDIEKFAQRANEKLDTEYENIEPPPLQAGTSRMIRKR